VESWLACFSSGSRTMYGLGFKTFLRFLEARLGGEWNAERVLKERKTDLAAEVYRFEDLTVEFYVWLRSTSLNRETQYSRVRLGRAESVHMVKRGTRPSDNYAKGMVTAVRSFFGFHRVALNLTVQQRRALGGASKPKESDYLFNVDDLERMSKVASPQEAYILLVGKDVGLRASDFIGLKQGQFAKITRLRQREEQPWFFGEVWTMKERVKAYPFLTEDGLGAAESWLTVLKSKNMRNDSEPMLLIDEKELTENLKRVASKAGIETFGSRIRFHCLRKFLIDRLSLKMSESKWKQIVGKKIGESAYVSPLNLKEAYAEVLEHLTIGQREGLLGLSAEDLKMLRFVAELVKKNPDAMRKMLESGL